jgi:hypothetical protein
VSNSSWDSIVATESDGLFLRISQTQKQGITISKISLIVIFICSFRVKIESSKFSIPSNSKPKQGK